MLTTFSKSVCNEKFSWNQTNEKASQTALKLFDLQWCKSVRTTSWCCNEPNFNDRILPWFWLLTPVKVDIGQIEWCGFATGKWILVNIPKSCISSRYSNTYIVLRALFEINIINHFHRNKTKRTFFGCLFELVLRTSQYVLLSLWHS